ncbi:MAG: AAA family ATPase, partial [Bacteroidetes bacterium]|nr:AAA family ATPase [Bacteroidota bacterium]
MITELRIENFKSFGSGTDALHLKPLNFIVGANASGKTNLVSALRFLKLAVVHNVEYAVNEFEGPGEVRNKIQRQREEPKPVRIGLRIEGLSEWGLGRDRLGLLFRSMDYTVEIDVRTEGLDAEVVSEHLVVEQVDGAGTPKTFELKRSKTRIDIQDKGNPELERIAPSLPIDPTRLLAGTPFFASQLMILRNYIEGWSFFNIRPDVARRSYKDSPDQSLGEYGEQLSAVLHRLEKQNGRGAIARIVDGLRDAVPGFKGVRTVPLGVERSFEVLEDRIKGGLSPGSVSDGTVRLMALLVAAYWYDHKSSLLVIEEPETGLHPHLSKHVMDLLRTVSERRQVIATTHNPAFLDELEPDEVILCDKPEGYTVVRTAAAVEDIETFRKTFRLGELWQQGALGG